MQDGARMRLLLALLLALLLGVASGYKAPATKPTAPATKAAKGNTPAAAAPPKASGSGGGTSSKPGPLATLFEVYTRGAADKASLTPEEAARQRDRQYTLLTGLPLKPYFERKTVRRQVAPDIWTLEQPQGFFNVTTPIRATVVRLADGRLWVHAPIAPTKECLRLLDEIGGEVAYIVLPTTAFEHKVFVADFARAYPKAKVYACVGQWAWPVNLPPPFRVDGGYISSDDQRLPWVDEIEHALLRPPTIGIGPANEVVFFHKRSKTLIVTDLVVFIDGAKPSEVVEVPDLLKAALDDPDSATPEDIPADTPANRQRGWARMALQILFLGPTRFSTFKLVERRLLVSPVIQTFVYSKVPEALVEFVDRIATRWAFTSVLPAHFNAPAKAGPADLQRAFAFAYQLVGKRPQPPKAKGAGDANPLAALFRGLQQGSTGGVGAGAKPVVYPEDDMAVLRFVNEFIKKSGVADR